MNKEASMSKNIFYLFLFFFGIHTIIYAQQSPQYTQYTYNMQVVNPAYAGSRESLNINMLGRSQWIGLEGAPKTGTLCINSPLGKKNVGGGLSIIYDEFGPLKETHFYGDVSYTINVSYEGSLAFGLKGGFSFQNVNESLLRFNETQTPGIKFNNNAYANFGFGMYYYEDNFYVGASIPNILSTNFLDTTISGTLSEAVNNSIIYLTSGVVFHINENLQIKPAMLLKYETLFPVTLDVSATTFIQNKVELGISYRLQESMSFIAAFFINDSLRIGYSYDYTLGNLSDYNNGSHEIMLLYDLPLKERKHRILYF